VTLISRLEQAEAGSRELDGLIEVATLFKGNSGYQLDRGKFYANDRRIVAVHEAPHYTTSIDAAMSLVPEGWQDVRQHHHVMTDGSIRSYAEIETAAGTFNAGPTATPALALCVAALKAQGVSE